MRALIATALIVLCVAAVADEPSRMWCLRLSADPPTIDGALSDVAWTTAASGNLRDAATHAEPKRATKTALTWDNDYLYVAFRCEDDAKPNARMTVRDANLWEEEVVEVFIDPDGDGTSYIEIEVNPLNTLFDAFILNNGRRTWVLRDWAMDGIQHAVAFDADGWSVEMALPFAAIAEARGETPKIGDEWRVNLYRIDRSDDPKSPEMTAWSPPHTRNYHKSDAFGSLVFAGVD